MTPRLLCVLGAECTGKTSLAQALAQALPAVWVPEYLRSWCDAQGRTPRREEQAAIVAAQVAAEDAAVAQARQAGLPWVVCDTSPLLTAVYSAYVFGDASLYTLGRALQQRYQHTWLMQPDFPWQADGLQRDGEAARLAVHVLLEREKHRHEGRPWLCLAGDVTQRLQAALAQLGQLDV